MSPDLLKAIERRAERTIYFNVSYFVMLAIVILGKTWALLFLVVPMLAVGIWASWRDDREIKALKRMVEDE